MRTKTNVQAARCAVQGDAATAAQVLHSLLVVLAAGEAGSAADVWGNAEARQLLGETAYLLVSESHSVQCVGTLLLHFYIRGP